MIYLKAILSLAGLGAVFGIMLGLAAKKFAVESDPRIEKITGVLPGANCGGCGYPGCSGLASAIVGGSAPVDGCPVGGQAVADKIAGIMGIQAVHARERQVARVMCGGGADKASSRFAYIGIKDCRAAELVSGGPKACTFGCLGFGTCVKACPFGAIEMGSDGLPVIDEIKCTGCGKCIAACPRGIIALVPVSKRTHVLCRSHARGAEVRKVCKVGCIGCGICVKTCPNSAIVLEDNLARIIPDKCDNCGKCIEKCPTKCITMANESDSRVAVEAGVGASGRPSTRNEDSAGCCVAK
ncbi:MAG TPA: RnfABCDGE type electron transport complex subunit B [Firmicutes bacterium]|nr:RnfABCDGE type electron transport complex subunit B [Bacillota bacterium]